MTKTAHYVTAIAVLLIVTVPLQAWRDRGWQAYEPATPVQWLQAGPAAKRLALGFDSLLADAYWIRTVVYFGRQRLSTAADKNYDLLHPLLELVTTLDPRFTVAYRLGAVFLSEPQPDGPGRPDLAIDLLKRGVAMSPERWEYLHAIGFVHYWSDRNYQEAAAWLEKASEIPGAPIWLKSSAALMRTEAGDREAARVLWGQLRDSADDPSLRRLAETRIAQFDALDAIDALNEAVWRFEARAGWPVRSWEELIAAGVLRRVPTDPAGVPYILDQLNQDVRLSDKSPLWPLPTGLNAPTP
jgi:tetratricopeptide (TPR) repeat protein